MLGATRIAGGIFLLLGVAAFGYLGRSVAVVPVLALVFTVSFALGKWRAWAHAMRAGQLGRSILGQGITYLVQLALVAILYFTGRGVGSLAGQGPSVDGLGVQDWMAIGGFAALALAIGLAVLLLERGQIADPDQLGEDDEDGVQLAPDPITEQGFWSAHHYSNSDHVYDDETPTTLNPARAFLSEAQIAAEEARLGVTLPPLLRRLYAMQNGGSGMGLWVPCPLPMHNAVGGWINPFSGYDDMTPLTSVETLAERISAYASDDQIDEFPRDAARMIVLAQWYRETLFLDYRKGDTPRVGFVDFDSHSDLHEGVWEDHALWWEDFDAFFADLRREVTPEEM